MFASCSCEFMLCWPTGLCSKGRNVSIRRHNNDSTELEVKTVTRVLWASHAFESTNKGVTALARVIDSMRKLDYSFTVEVRKSMCGIQEILRTPLSITMPFD